MQCDGVRATDQHPGAKTDCDTFTNVLIPDLACRTSAVLGLATYRVAGFGRRDRLARVGDRYASSTSVSGGTLRTPDAWLKRLVSLAADYVQHCRCQVTDRGAARAPDGGTRK